jgi:hypothetical protein
MASDGKAASQSGSERRRYNEISSEEPSAESSQAPSRPGNENREASKHRKRGRVRFNSNSEVNDEANKRSLFPLREQPGSPALQVPRPSKSSLTRSKTGSITEFFRHASGHEKTNPLTDLALVSTESSGRPRPPSVLRNDSAAQLGGHPADSSEGSGGHAKEKALPISAAQGCAQGVAMIVGSHSELASRRTSVEGEIGDLDLPFRRDDIPLVDLEGSSYEGIDYDTEEESQEKHGRPLKDSTSSEAHKLVRAHTRSTLSSGLRIPNGSTPGLISGQVTPVEERDSENYVARPAHYHGGILS